MNKQPAQTKAGWGCLYILIIVGFAINFFSLIIGRGSAFWTVVFGVAVFLMMMHAKKSEEANK